MRYSFKAIDIVILLFIFAYGFFFAGFFYPDTVVASRIFLLWIVRALFFIPGIAVIIFLVQIRMGKISVQRLKSILFYIIILILIIYPIINLTYNTLTTMRNISDFHPYLQIKPNKLDYDHEVDNTFRIICLGGSTTEYKDGHNAGWPERVEKLLQNSLNNSNIRVYNQGRQWYTTLHTMIHYQTNIRPHRPDVIIIMHTINDLLHNADFSYFSHSPFRDDYGHFYGPLNRILPHNNLEDFIINNFRFFWYSKPREPVTQKVFPGLLPFRRNLEAIITLALEDNTKVVLLTQPSLYTENPDSSILPRLHMLNREAVGPDKQWSYDSALTGFIQYKQALTDLAKEKQTILIDLDNEIPKTLNYFFDDVHYTDRGFNLVAEKVAEGLLDKAAHVFEGLE
jgi:lysophospholipase L1-like esterase